MKALVLAIMLAFSVTSFAAPVVKKQEVKKVVKKPVPKKDDGKIKPLEEGRKVPTLKKKYKKD